jgi:hypothetical protein
MTQQVPRNLSTGSGYPPFPPDIYTPSNAQAAPLDTNLYNERTKGLWGTTPAEYVAWFNGLWHTGDASQWGPDVFTADAIMLDPTGTSTGADGAAADFLLLFKYFPDLRGEVMSWGHNDSEIFINWRFVVGKGINCPVIDKFSFSGGLVSYRQAYFDTMTLLAYLIENHGSGPLVDYFLDRFWREAAGKEVLFLRSLLKALASGIVRPTGAPLSAPSVRVQARDGAVDLTWTPVPGALSYTVKRSTTPDAPYPWIAPNVQTTSFTDTGVTNETKYYYVVSANRAPNVILPQLPLPIYAPEGTLLSVK